MSALPYKDFPNMDQLSEDDILGVRILACRADIDANAAWLKETEVWAKDEELRAEVRRLSALGGKFLRVCGGESDRNLDPQSKAAGEIANNTAALKCPCKNGRTFTPASGRTCKSYVAGTEEAKALCMAPSPVVVICKCANGRTFNPDPGMKCTDYVRGTTQAIEKCSHQ